ncbi:unnamed protein product [Clavelina lepadiformis]|uniref:BTB domain-containing protein n=1 Tax=Clavelina lepadiformis TaxID=159417 RepID=A0ABP0G0E9_CLALP
MNVVFTLFEETGQGDPETFNDLVSWQRSHQKWQTFRDLRMEGLFFDVVLKTIDGTAFPAHRIILCACSPYFKSLFSGRWESGNREEITIPGVTTQVMDHIFQFAYMREVSRRRLVHGNGIPTGIPWEMSHGMGWDGTARIAIPMALKIC